MSPGFTVLEDAAAAEVSARARDDVARLALADPGGPVGRAYAHFSVELDWRALQRHVRRLRGQARGDRRPM